MSYVNALTLDTLGTLEIMETLETSAILETEIFIERESIIIPSGPTPGDSVSPTCFRTCVCRHPQHAHIYGAP